MVTVERVQEPLTPRFQFCAGCLNPEAKQVDVSVTADGPKTLGSVEGGRLETLSRKDWHSIGISVCKSQLTS